MDGSPFSANTDPSGDKEWERYTVCSDLSGAEGCPTVPCNETVSVVSGKTLSLDIEGPSPVSITTNKPDDRTVTPSSGIVVGDIINISTTNDWFKGDLELVVGGQSLTLHTSCSEPVNIGDQFGSLKVVGFQVYP